jgi:two-component system, NarL family, nitrate/nitrite response regulator NarL
MEIRVFIVDDHQIMIDGIKALLVNEPGITVAGETTDPAEVITAMNGKDVNVLITDISMGVLSGIELTKQVKEFYPEVNVLGLSMFGDKETISKMLEAGVNGYVLKNTGKEELIQAVKKIASGGVYFSEDVTLEMMRKITEKEKSSDGNTTSPLTAREVEIVKLIASEFSNAAIGEKLFISERTVETHRKNIFRKTNTKSVAGLIRYAIDNKII